MRLIGHSVSDADGRLLSMDGAACDLLERPRRDLVGRSYLDFTHPADRRRNASLIDRLPTESAPITFRKRYLTPDKESIEVDVHVSRLNAGAETRLVGTLYHVDPEQARFAPGILWSAARQLAQLNDLRRDLLGSDLFCDDAMTILLQLYMDEAEGRPSTPRSIAAAVGLGSVATLRWLRALETKELIELSGAGSIAQLTGIGVRKMLQLLAASAA